MPCKSVKLGMKSWGAAEFRSKHVYNVLPYSGGFEREHRNGKPFAEDVVTRLNREHSKQRWL